MVNIRHALLLSLVFAARNRLFSNHSILVFAMYAAGQLVYHGPREEVVAFFASCGFQCPPRKAVPDFLQELTSRKDQQVLPLNWHHI